MLSRIFLLLSTAETVDLETPASAATSEIVECFSAGFRMGLPSSKDVRQRQRRQLLRVDPDPSPADPRRGFAPLAAESHDAYMVKITEPIGAPRTGSRSPRSVAEARVA